MVTAACARCKEYSTSPLRFRSSIPGKRIIYNQDLATVMLWLDGNPVLHLVETHRNFWKAIRVKETAGLWDAFVTCWSTVYLRCPNVIALDQESSFALITVMPSLHEKFSIEKILILTIMKMLFL